jgi:hypothetical protein
VSAAVGGAAAARRWRRAPDALWRATPAGAVVLARHGGEPQALNPTAAAVWDLLTEPITVDGAARVLADAFDADLAEVRADVDALVARFAAAGLAVTAPPAGPDAADD